MVYNTEEYIIVTEIWKDIKDYEGLYQVSNLGRVKSVKKEIKYCNGKIVIYPEKILKGFISTSGYFAVDLYKNNTRKRFYVHRLVAEEFIENPLNKPEINHIDEDKLNNRVENLEWCTSSENKLSGTVIERANKTRKDRKVGYKRIGMYDLNNELIQVFDNIALAEECSRINRKTIYNSCNNRVKSRKYIWKYL